MKNGIKVIVLVGVVGAVLAGMIGYMQYNKPHEDITAANAETSVNASDLVSEFAKEGSAANTRYSDKIVEISGTVKNILRGDSLSSIVFEPNPEYSITIEMVPELNKKTSKIAPGSAQKIKALYVGFLEGEPDMEIPGDIKFKKGSFVE